LLRANRRSLPRRGPARLAAYKGRQHPRLSVVLNVKRGLERETGLEPATFSLEGLSGYAPWHPSWTPEHFVSSYRVLRCPHFDR
jgi:hypothetical protein